MGAPGLAFGAYGEGDLPAPDRGAHGDLAMDAQRERLRELLPERDVTRPPPGIAPVVWRSLVPEVETPTPQQLALGEALCVPRLPALGSAFLAGVEEDARSGSEKRT
jgi:hypothetical protein